ncbi:hypothetical protein, partial [Salmonella sp. s51228]|uniref:hypothetical protein n=1 Tax=Salmonella sp. s51228 TaxID=3159652 RepID=UPI00397F1A56
WSDIAIDRILPKVRSQLDLYSKNIINSLNSFKFKARFGNFYLRNCKHLYETMSRSFSLSQLEDELKNSKVYRNQLNRDIKPKMFEKKETSDE